MREREQRDPRRRPRPAWEPDWSRDEDRGDRWAGPVAFLIAGGIMSLCCLGPLFLPGLISAIGGLGLWALPAGLDIVLLPAVVIAGGMLLHRAVGAARRAPNRRDGASNRETSPRT